MGTQEDRVKKYLGDRIVTGWDGEMVGEDREKPGLTPRFLPWETDNVISSNGDLLQGRRLCGRITSLVLDMLSSGCL